MPGPDCHHRVSIGGLCCPCKHAFVGRREKETAPTAPQDVRPRLPLDPGAPFQRLSPPSLPVCLPHTLNRRRQPSTCTDDEKWWEKDEKSSQRRWRKGLEKRVPVVALWPRKPLSRPPLPFSQHHVALPELLVQPQAREEPVRHCCEKKAAANTSRLFNGRRTRREEHDDDTATGRCPSEPPPPTQATDHGHLHKTPSHTR